jgi:hypothetical protein
MERITNQMLEQQVSHLNTLFNNEEKTPYNPLNDVGFYTLSHAYGGVELQKVANARGGVNCVSRGGHISKRQLHDWICAYICGIEQAHIAAVHAGLYK